MSCRTRWLDELAAAEPSRGLLAISFGMKVHDRLDSNVRAAGWNSAWMCSECDDLLCTIAQLDSSDRLAETSESFPFQLFSFVSLVALSCAPIPAKPAFAQLSFQCEPAKICSTLFASKTYLAASLSGFPLSKTCYSQVVKPPVFTRPKRFTLEGPFTICDQGLATSNYLAAGLMEVTNVVRLG